jgi:hypothetical protein
LRPKRILGWILLIAAVPFWAYAITSASASGFFEDSLAVQMMIMGGAVSMLGGLLTWYEY